jgi:hypothetical protein
MSFDHNSKGKWRRLVQNWLNKTHWINVKQNFFCCNKGGSIKEAASEIQNLVFFNRALFYFRELAKLFKLTGSKAEKIISSYL